MLSVPDFTSTGMGVVWHDGQRSDPACEVTQCVTEGRPEIVLQAQHSPKLQKTEAAGAAGRTRGGMGDHERRECGSKSGRQGCREAHSSGEVVEH